MIVFHQALDWQGRDHKLRARLAEKIGGSVEITVSVDELFELGLGDLELPCLLVV